VVKRNIDHSGETPLQKKRREESPRGSLSLVSGIAGDPLSEPLPRFIKSKCEELIQGQNNSYIVLGRDRPQSRMSGYGGLGDTQAGMIDVVVGRLGAAVKQDAWVDNDFRRDAARMYISQKANIDEYFGLSAGSVGNSTAKSALALKADAVRVIAREGIKLITGTDGINSQGGTVDAILGIDLNAGNEGVAKEAGADGLQPMVKAKNLEAALDSLSRLVSSLGGILSAFLSAQMTYNSVIATHTHVSPFYGSPTTPSTEVSSAGTKAQMNMMNDCISGLQKHKSNIVSWRNTYVMQHGKKWIGSRFNSVN
jgi:hypothetical protein